MRKIFLLSILVVAFLGVSLTVLTVYRSKAQETTSENLFIVLNEKAKAARGGNPAAVQELVDTIVKVTGFKDYLVGQPGLEFKDRVKRAEVLYRQNQHAGITEEKIVYAVNGLKNKLGTPEYSNTSEYEIRRLRTAILPMFPELIGKNRNAPNFQSTGDNIPTEMSPAEAVFVLASLLFQKMNNPDYQLTPSERASLWATEHDYKLNYEGTLPERIANNPRFEEMEQAVTNGLASLSATDIQNLPKRMLDILGLEP
ncbi:MAG: hypothetical protein KF762_12465 [Acidobacteria bacterium]|nr:hypothetical protein [Acidobacteriota bacterium]